MQLLDGKFTKYSYDSKTNLRLYGSETAPSYNLKNVVTPTKLFVGESDCFSTVENAQKLSEELPIDSLHLVDRPEWSHIDFAFSQYARKLVYDYLIADMSAYRYGALNSSNIFLNCNLTSSSVDII